MLRDCGRLSNMFMLIEDILVREAWISLQEPSRYDDLVSNLFKIFLKTKIDFCLAVTSVWH